MLLNKKISLFYLIFSSAWLLLSQVVFTALLWDVDSDRSELYNSEYLHWALWRALYVVGYGFIAAVIFGLLLFVVIITTSKRRAGNLDLINIGSGLLFVAMILISAVILEGRNEYYSPPPQLPQFIRIGAVVVLDFVLGITIWRLIRRYRVGN